MVNCEDFTSADLVAGTIIAVKFTANNTGAVNSLSLNINGTGAKQIKYINNGIIENLPSEGCLRVDTTYYFYYDGINWVALFNYDTTYGAMSEAEALAGTATTARTITAARLKQVVEHFAELNDVQINGTSIVTNGVANVPIASRTNLGAVSINNANDNSYGLAINDSGMLYISSPSAAMIKQGTQAYKPIVPNNQHISTFYGLAKAAGDTTQSQSGNAVGSYTEDAKSAIRTMLGLEEVYQDYSSALTALGVI